MVWNELVGIRWVRSWQQVGDLVGVRCGIESCGLCRFHETADMFRVGQDSEDHEYIETSSIFSSEEKLEMMELVVAQEHVRVDSFVNIRVRITYRREIPREKLCLVPLLCVCVWWSN